MRVFKDSDIIVIFLFFKFQFRYFKSLLLQIFQNLVFMLIINLFNVGCNFFFKQRASKDGIFFLLIYLLFWCEV